MIRALLLRLYDEEYKEKMKQEKLDLFYDTEADILEITMGEPSPCVFDEVEDDLFEARDEETNELKGYKVFNFLKRGGFDNVKKIEIHLPANVHISS